MVSIILGCIYTDLYMDTRMIFSHRPCRKQGSIQIGLVARLMTYSARMMARKMAGCWQDGQADGQDACQ